MLKEERSLIRQGQSERSCSGCTFWDDEVREDPAVNNSSASHTPHLEALSNQIRTELQQIQSKFATDMERRLQEALNADKALAEVQRKAMTKQTTAKSGERVEMSSPGWWSVRGGATKYTPLSTNTEDREPTETQLKFAEEWLEDAESGELDVYTCLGLSNCFSWTPDTRKIILKASAVLLLQVLVPVCLLVAEINGAQDLGPAEGDIGFRLTGAALFGFAIYSMYNGASDRCRTSLLNLVYHYSDVHAGHRLPLLAGELSNVFTAFVLSFSLYSIFTTQSEPADLILNAVAVNFLADCDGTFVDRDMKEDALENFKQLSNGLFASQQKQIEDPSEDTWVTKLVHRALYLIVIGGAFGMICFLFWPQHSGGNHDTLIGAARHVVDATVRNRTTASSHPGMLSGQKRNSTLNG